MRRTRATPVWASIGILAAAGLGLGAVSGLADRIWRDRQQRLMSRARAVSVIAWVAGMGARFWFAFYAYHSGGPAVASFSAAHDITGAGIWTTALVLMAFGQVLARLAVLQIRRSPGQPPAVCPPGPHRRRAAARH